MRTLLIYLSLFFLSIASIHAQSMKKMAQKTEFESRLAKEAQTVESIESDFTQVKYLDVFDEKVTSKGKFYYQKTHKICMEYFRPMDYLIVINGSKLKIVSDGKKSIMNLSSNTGQTHYIFYYILLCYFFAILLIINTLSFVYIDCFSYLYKIY